MKKLFLAFILAFSLHSVASVSILSDLDDTIKITQSGGNASDVVGTDVFTAISDFYESAQDYSNEMHILSASPKFMKKHIEKVLEKHQIDFASLTLRPSLLENKFDYKLREIKRILANSSDDFILIGDDLGEDPEVYSAIAELYPERILGIYIRVIKGRPIKNPENLITYYTSFDLFLREYLAGRMGRSRVLGGLEKMLGEVKLEFIFPRRAQCPRTYDVWFWHYHTEFAREASVLTQKLLTFCGARQSVNILP